MTQEQIATQATRILAEIDEQTNGDNDPWLLRKLAEEAVWDWWRSTPHVQTHVAYLALRRIRAEIDRREELR